jgi:hypothetical protein
MPKHVSGYGYVDVTHILNDLEENNNVVAAERPHQQTWER